MSRGIRQWRVIRRPSTGVVVEVELAGEVEVVGEVGTGRWSFMGGILENIIHSFCVKCWKNL